MPVRTLEIGSQGEDVRVIQRALNRNGADLKVDGDFRQKTYDAVVAFQKEQQKRNPKFMVDGKVGKETRQALFPLVGVTLNVHGIRQKAAGSSTPSSFRKPSIGFGLPPLTLNPPDLSKPPVNLKLPPLTPGAPRPEKIPGLFEPIALPPIAAPSGSSIIGKDWQQVAQGQVQFTGLFRNPVGSFAVGIQTVFNKSDADNHVEPTTGCLLQSPIGFQDGQGNNFTLACFANATWVDPILHFGMFHLANPYAQVQAQGNLSGPTLPTLQLGAFPININVDLNDDGLQFNLNGGATWNLTFEGDGIKSTWGPQVGIGIVGKFRGF